MAMRAKMGLYFVAIASVVAVTAIFINKTPSVTTPTHPLFCMGESRNTKDGFLQCLSSMIESGSVDDAKKWLAKAGFNHCSEGEIDNILHVSCRYTECADNYSLPFDKSSAAKPPTFYLRIRMELGELIDVRGSYFHKRPRGKC